MDLSLPLLRLLGLSKLRIAQVNTTIGVIKSLANQDKDALGGNTEEQFKTSKILSTFLDAISK